jgi:hypothetical protein
MMKIQSDFNWEVAEAYHRAYEALRVHYSVRRSIEIIMEGGVREALKTADATICDAEYAVIKDVPINDQPNP